MKTMLLVLLALAPMLGGCGREHRHVQARDGWQVVDYPAGGSRRVGMFAIQRASLTPLRGSQGEFHPALIIEPRDGVLRGAVRIRSAGFYVDAPVGTHVTLDVSFDGRPPEPVRFQRDNVDLQTTRAFAGRLQSHRMVEIALPGGDNHHPPGVVGYRLDGLGPQLAALDAEFHARRQGVGLVERILRAMP